MAAVAGAAAAALVLAGCSAGDGTGSRGDGRSIEAYVEPGSGAVQRVRDAAPHVATIGIDGVTLTDDGSGLHDVPDGIPALVRAAHGGGATTELLVSNYSETIGDFSPEVGTAVLSSTSHRRAVATAIARVAAGLHVDGVQIDVESLRRRDTEGLVEFAGTLRTAVRDRLGDDATVSMAVMAATDHAGYRDRGYDLRALSEHVDRFVLMTYDQHGPWGGPGPIGALGWSKRSVAAAVADGVPRDRLDLGVAGYGYAWPSAPGAGPLTPPSARRLAGDAAVWSRTDGEWSADADGTEVHWSDARSFAARRELARGLGLHGTAMWSLNLSPLDLR